MAPVSRCDLRLTNNPKGVRLLEVTTPKLSTMASTSAISSSTNESTTMAPTTTAPTTTTTGATESAMATTKETDLEDEAVPEPAHAKDSRDSADILQQAPGFSTGLTRDMAEVRDHKMHEASASRDGAICPQLVQCKADSEEEHLDDDVLGLTPVPSAGCGGMANYATPGDVCNQFSQSRADSPVSAKLKSSVGPRSGGTLSDGTHKGSVDPSPKVCKNKYGTSETYTSLWGSSKAVSARKKLVLEMKKKRKYLEKLHEKNRRRRLTEKRRAKEKRRAMKCCDQSKIPVTKDDISVNKAFCFRFNYNKQLPFMPSAMNQHFQRFKKPPFKHFHKASRACHKHVDEFEKLRVTEAK